jgi:hypothetical protein
LIGNPDFFCHSLEKGNPDFLSVIPAEAGIQRVENYKTKKSPSGLFLVSSVIPNLIRNTGFFCHSRKLRSNLSGIQRAENYKPKTPHSAGFLVSEYHYHASTVYSKLIEG